MKTKILLFKILLLTSWCSLALAESRLDKIETLLSIKSVVIVLLLSSLSGATALTIKLDSKLKEGSLTNPILFGVSNILGSWLAGFLGFFVTSTIDTTSLWNQLIIILVFAYFGSKVLEKFADTYKINFKDSKDDK